MKAIVLGSTGMAGHMITKYLRNQGHEVITVARSDADVKLDVENYSKVKSFFDNTQSHCDFMINCVGLLVKESCDNPDRAVWVNGWFPQYAATRLQDRHTRLIHLSTDCVFDGSEQGNYEEHHVPTESNLYGRSKAMGEVRNNKDITFRMSIIGPELKRHSGLLDWFVKNSETQLPGWTNAYWNGITTLELARCINVYMSAPAITGLYHLVNNSNRISKYDLLWKINAAYKLGKTVKKVKAPKAIDKVLIDTRQEIDFGIPNYDRMLQQLADFKI